jgi:hypothetical protein
MIQAQFIIWANVLVGKCLSGQMSFWANVKCLSGQMSFWANVFWSNVFLGKCLSGQMTFWANVFWTNVFLGKCRSGQMSYGQTSFWANILCASVHLVYLGKFWADSGQILGSK